MRKIFTLLLCCILFQFATKAQYVNIPDSNFRSFLKSNYPSCFNASDLMDTTCTALLPGTTMYISNDLQIHNLDGIQYFKKLETLYCMGRAYYHDSTYLETIIHLPHFLKTLDCRFNSLTSLPTLPSTIRFLNC